MRFTDLVVKSVKQCFLTKVYTSYFADFSAASEK